MVRGRSAALLFGAIAAFVYCVLLYFFISSDSFGSIWMLYIGNVLFGITIAAFMFYLANHVEVSEKSVDMVTSGLKACATGIFVSGVVALLFLYLLVPALFNGSNQAVPSSSQLVQNLSKDDSNLALTVYMNLLLGNIAAGAFATIMFTYTSKWNQTKDKEPEILKEN